MAFWSSPPNAQREIQYTMRAQADVLAALLTENPAIHYWPTGEVAVWKLDDEVLRYICDHVLSDSVSLETGQGYSTIIFASCGSNHTVIAPDAGTRQRIVDWCERHAVNMERVRFFTERSEDVLPTLEVEPLDLVLIDGRHAFPTPFIDWYYSVRMLKVGGIVIVDDMHIRTCRVLKEFMSLDTERWEAAADLPRVAVFRKIADDPHKGDWSQQPWCANELPSSGPKRRQARWPRLSRLMLRTPVLWRFFADDP